MSVWASLIAQSVICLVNKKSHIVLFTMGITFSVMCISLIYCQILTTITFELSLFCCVRCIDKTFFTCTFSKLEVFLWTLRTTWNLNTKFQKKRLWHCVWAHTVSYSCHRCVLWNLASLFWWSLQTNLTTSKSNILGFQNDKLDIFTVEHLLSDGTPAEIARMQ